MSDYLLVDAKNLLWRSASVMKLSAGDTKTGGTFGFLKGLIRVHELFGGKIIVCWDDWENGPKARKDIYPAYKKRREADPAREKMVKEIVQQMGDLRTFLAALGVRQTRSLNWEADDVMATLARKLDGKVVIYTGDKDLLQCISGKVTVARPMPNGDIDEYDNEKFRKEFLVTVGQYVDYKALVGDSSDNIPGCKGIGPKSAVEIINIYDNVEHAVAAAMGKGWKLTPRWARLLMMNRDEIAMSKRLSAVNANVKLLNRFGEKDFKAAKKLLMKYRMSSLLTKFDKLKQLTWK